jgi:hypothetical protein
MDDMTDEQLVKAILEHVQKMIDRTLEHRSNSDARRCSQMIEDRLGSVVSKVERLEKRLDRVLTMVVKQK